MSKITLPMDEAITRLESGIHQIQVEYEFLSRYLDERDKESYAKAFVDLEDISQTLRCGSRYIKE